MLQWSQGDMGILLLWFDAKLFIASEINPLERKLPEGRSQQRWMLSGKCRHCQRSPRSHLNAEPASLGTSISQRPAPPLTTSGFDPQCLQSWGVSRCFYTVTCIIFLILKLPMWRKIQDFSNSYQHDLLLLPFCSRPLFPLVACQIAPKTILYSREMSFTLHWLLIYFIYWHKISLR